MKVKGIYLPEVKNQAAARKQAAYCLIQIENRQRRERKLMENQAQIREKIARLQTQLEQLDRTINDLQIGDQDWKNYYQRLMTEHQLIEAEILETRSSLIQKKINELESQVGAQHEPSADSVHPEG